MRRSSRAAWVLLAIPLVAGACDVRATRTNELTVFAAASLITSFQDLTRGYEQLHPDVRFVLHFAGTPQLVLQLREGAPADVFAAADEPSMRRVVDSGRVAGTPLVFARNHLMVVTAKGNPMGVRGLNDLARADLRVVLCGPEVPAGRYARQALRTAGVAVRSVSDEPSVNAVVSKVALGEVDAGLVYATDVARAADQVDGVDIAAEHDVIAAYPIAVLSDSVHRELGESFLAYVASPDGQAILRRAGFLAP